MRRARSSCFHALPLRRWCGAWIASFTMTITASRTSMQRMKMVFATRGGKRVAEFTEVLRQRARMCNSYAKCRDCGLDVFSSCSYYPVDKMEQIERVIMDWAVAHPEPRYPTWNEWYQECLPDAPFKCRRAFMNISCGIRYCDECLSEPIPADIAQKLGIKPITEGSVNK